ncbi:MAG: DUF6519 domain-containing protein [Gallionellaceae bacterium]|nr:DUF6519 domain-containing protein [Gallionellaceae bacterium]
MKTQISRDSFRPEQRFSGVYLQQGRMILDADWNELSDIEKARLVDALRDAIAGGAPRVGGLRVFADPAGSVNIRIQPGALYVEGVPARLDAAAPLPVNAQPDYPIQADYSGQNLKLYVDVWERGVSALEQSALMDAALHGADTATRSQTMLQVKWCANTLNPLNEASNPSIGTAPLTLKLRLIASGGDTCDPCASQVKVDERIGNYLFRVEVHDYEPATQWLTLKWSRDNGAEACAVAAMPAGFNQGDWVWEYFDNDTERLLGNHFAANPLKLRGLIKETCVTPTGVNEPKTHVRQWDGTIKIKLDSGALSGRDRGVALFAGAVSNQAQGRANFAGGVLKLNLERLELELAVAGKRFVPGDYWLAEVREAEDESGDTVLSAATPRGVRHHYLFLGELGVDKKLVAQDDAFKRRMAFPPLTDIIAADVGFTDTCAKLFAGATNVQQALDNLCAIDADDIAYPLPNCGANEGKSIKDRLKALLDPDSDGKLTVKTALDNLLCQLNATSLPYSVPACPAGPSVRELLGLAAGDNNVAPVLDKLLCEFKANDLPLDKSDAALCGDLKVPAVVTVQDALKILCGKSGGGCAVVATSPEHLGQLLQEFANSSSAKDLWICLKAGSYPLSVVPAIANKRSLRISGEGPESVAIAFSGDTLALAADEVILENLSLTFGNSAGRLAITADTARAHGCHFSRTSGSVGGPAMLTVAGAGNGVCRMSWRDNVLYAQVKTTSGNGNLWAASSVVGDAQVSKAVLALGKEELLVDKTAYDAALNQAVTAIMAMTPDKRLAWKTKLDQVVTPISRAAAITRVAKAGSESLSMSLAQGSLTYSETLLAVEELVAQWVTYSPDCALRLVNHKVGGVLEGNRVDGWVLLGNGINGYSTPARILGVSLEGNVVKRGGESLNLVGNSLDGLKSNIPSAAVNNKKNLVATLDAHARITLSDNHFGDFFNTITAASLVAQGNTWAGSDLGYAVVDRATFTGNLVEIDAQANSVIMATTSASRMAGAGNLRLDVTPMRA